MSKFNIEQIKKELVLLIDDMPVELNLGHKKTANFLSFLKSTLAVITNYEDKIFELENRLKECENGYEGTLFLDRCKLHDAEENVKELTEKEKKSDRVFSDLYKEAETYLAQRECLRNQVKNLTKENERLHASCTELTRRMQDNVRAENEELRKSRECDLRKFRADTVRKMQERITEHATNGYPRKVRLDVIDQIAKEMVEGAKNDTR